MGLFRTRTPGLQRISGPLVSEARTLLLRHPRENALAGGRFDDLARVGQVGREFSGVMEDGAVTALLWHGVSLGVLEATRSEQHRAIAGFVRGQRTRYASLVGERTQVAALWPLIAPHLGPAREIRGHQPLLEASAVPSAPRHPGVRRALPTELDVVYPAARAMFLEEVGVDPARADGGRSYRARVLELLQAGRTYVVRDGETVVFKADVGAVFGPVAQIHGVWVDPAHRGRGIAKSAMVTVAEQVAREHAPQVTLYVNDFNARARAAYAAAGFVEVGQLATVLL